MSAVELGQHPQEVSGSPNNGLNNLHVLQQQISGRINLMTDSIGTRLHGFQEALSLQEQQIKDLVTKLPFLMGALVHNLEARANPQNIKKAEAALLIITVLALGGCSLPDALGGQKEPTPVPPTPTSVPAEPAPEPALPSPTVGPTPTIVLTPTTVEKPSATPTIVTPKEIIRAAGVGDLTESQMQFYNLLETDVKEWAKLKNIGGELFTTLDQTGFGITIKTSDEQWGAWDQNKKLFVFLAAPQIGKLEWGGLAGMLAKDQQGNIISRYAFNQTKGAWELMVPPTPVPSPTVEVSPTPNPRPTPDTFNLLSGHPPIQIYNEEGVIRQGVTLNIEVMGMKILAEKILAGDVYLQLKNPSNNAIFWVKAADVNQYIPGALPTPEPQATQPAIGYDTSRHFATQAVLSGELGRTAITAARVDPSGFEFTFDGSGTLFHVGGNVDKIIDAEHGVVLINNPVLGKFRYQFPKPGNDNVLNKSLIRVKRIMPDGGFSTTIVYLDNISFGSEGDVRAGEGDWIAFFPNFNNFAALNKTGQGPDRIALMQAAIKQFDAAEDGKGAVPGFISLISR